MKPRLAIVLAGALAASATAGGPAAAIDDTKPAVSCYGQLFTDKAGDAVRGHPAFAGEAGSDNLDLIDGFFKYDAGKGDEATTINLRVKNLTKDVPTGSTALIWELDYVGKSGVAGWVRAATDFSGVVTYDYGGQTDGGATTFNTREGSTTGNFFEGAEGLIQIVIPASLEPKGQALKGMSAHAYEPLQVLPSAAPTPIKGGQLYEQDTAAIKGSYTIGQACPAATPPAPAGDSTPASKKPVTADAPLPLKLKTKSVRLKKAKKLALKLSSSEALTKVAAQLRKGRKVLAKGSLATLDGNGTMKLKLAKPKKGSYVIDFVGSDASGARRFTSAKFKIN